MEHGWPDCTSTFVKLSEPSAIKPPCRICVVVVFLLLLLMVVLVVVVEEGIVVETVTVRRSLTQLVQMSNLSKRSSSSHVACVK